jgi:signal transduction histidine kinase
MRFRLPLPTGLKANALLISGCLITLTALLGVRAYTVARVHFLETRALLERDLPVQGLLSKLEAAGTAKQQARKKWEITHDLVYADLILKYQEAVARTEREIERIRPGFFGNWTAVELSNVPEDRIQSVRARLAQEREQMVRHARDTAEGLLRLILSALVLSLIITAWLVILLYRGLMQPLRALEETTAKLREGQLSTRMSEQGVTELRELAIDFNSMAERLEALDRAKNEFLAMISHEIKNPMAALKEGLGLLAASDERKLPPESQRRCVSACVIASKRLEFMINNLLNLSRSESGLFQYEFSRRDLCAAVQAAIDEVRPIAEKRSMSIRLQAPESLTASFHWDGIVQAFVNLLLNAIKYGSEGSSIEVAIRGADTEGIQVSVANSGKEIAPEELQNIFDRFYRGTNSLKQQGMGVGLHVVKRVIEAHRGAVSARSESGNTRMLIELPAGGAV